MLSAWWLCLIIPASVCVGYLLCGFMLLVKLADESDVDDSAGN
jgi:hypothetical protein